MALLAGGTYAYFTVERTAYNVITMGTLDMELVEETTGGVLFPTEEEGGMVTVQAIKELVPELEDAGITFVTVSDLAK